MIEQTYRAQGLQGDANNDILANYMLEQAPLRILNVYFNNDLEEESEIITGDAEECNIFIQTRLFKISVLLGRGIL